MRNTILLGDARELARTLPDESVSMICTSPPYWNLRSYLLDGHEDKGKEIGSEQTPAECAAGIIQPGDNSMIDLEPMIDPDNWETIGFYVKGHVDKQAFADEVSDFLDIDDNRYRADEIQHLYMRWGVTSFWHSDKILMAFDYSEPGPGRFKATRIIFGP